MERWVEAVLSPTDQAKCDLLEITIMQYVGMVGMGNKQHQQPPGISYTVRKRQSKSYVVARGWPPFVNLCRRRPDTTAGEVCIFRSTDEAIKGATNKKYFFPGVT